jgi:hypothetical protein
MKTPFSSDDEYESLERPTTIIVTTRKVGIAWWAVFHHLGHTSSEKVPEGWKPTTFLQVKRDEFTATLGAERVRAEMIEGETPMLVIVLI